MSSTGSCTIFPADLLRSNIRIPLSPKYALVFNNFSGKGGKQASFHPQCTRKQNTLPEVSFGRVLQFYFDISLFQRRFCDFSTISGVCCRSLRNLFAEDEGAGVAAGQMQGAGLLIRAAQLPDGAAGCREFLLTRSALHCQ